MLPHSFHRVITAWFQERFGHPTDVQVRAWSAITAGEFTLIAAPTGSGKTLAALLPCIDRIVSRKSSDGESRQAPKGVRVLYITPLKALNNDIHHHMFRFAAEMSETARELSEEWTGFQVGVRTGDTSQSTRASMLRSPPDLLVTTPESLYLMLTSNKAREILRTVEQVIVDEIHDLASDKRGVHLSLSLERLGALCGKQPQRIGVSATQKPMWRVAQYLGGWSSEEGGETPRPVSIVESLMDKRFQVSVAMPCRGVKALDKEAVWKPLVDRLLEQMQGARSVLIFVNNRRLCERLTLRLNDHVGYEMARSHHGSVSRQKRLEVEALLKEGNLRCLVATSSLELGIDVGYVDLVIQLDSPKDAAAGIQRIGRGGHGVGDISRGYLVIRSRGELAEAAVLSKAIAARDIEEIRIPRWSLDVMAQHVVSAVAAENWSPEQLFRLFIQSDCYREFPWERFEGMLLILSGMYPFVRPLLLWDRVKGALERVPASAMAASLGAGTIPQTSSFPVHHAESRLHLGELDEEFVYESRVGDVFQLGTTAWMIRSIKENRVYVTESSNGLSEIPFWKAEAGGRSPQLGQAIGKLLGDIAGSRDRTELREAMAKRLQLEYGLEEEAASELMAYVIGQAAVSRVPTDKVLVVEYYKDDAFQHHLVIHSLFGKRINRTWEMVLRSRFDSLCPHHIYSNAKDDGLEFVFPEWDPIWLEELQRVNGEFAERLLLEQIPRTSVFGKAFREIAETSLLLTRGFERQPSWKKRRRSEELLKAALPYADRFPFLKEAYDICLEQVFDLPGLIQLLQQIQEGQLGLVTVSGSAPSPFALRYMNDYAMSALYESDVLGRDLQARLLQVSRSLASEWFDAGGIRSVVSPKVMEELKRRLDRPGWLEASTASLGEKLRRLLKERGDTTAAELEQLTGESVQSTLVELEQRGVVKSVMLAGEERWISGDEQSYYYELPGSDEAAQFILRRYVSNKLGFRLEELRRSYELQAGYTQGLLDQWITEGFIEEPVWHNDEGKGVYYTSNLAAWVVQRSLGEYRTQMGPVPAGNYAAALLAGHRLAPEYRLSGVEGLLEAVKQLQGLLLPLSHWESILFPARVSDYRKEYLDQLCASGEVHWIGRKRIGEKEGSIAFFLAEEGAFSSSFIKYVQSETPETAQPQLLQLLEAKGASFLTALARETGELPSELLPKLMELVWEGRAANDQFAPLRTTSAIKGVTSKASGFQSGLGRWYPLRHQAEEETQTQNTALAWCKDWIRRFGFLSRDTVTFGSPYPWDRITLLLGRLEEWGMVTRGFFVQGVQSQQFTTPDMAEQLRNKPNRLVGAGDSAVLVAAVDPANPYGAWVSWPQVPGISFARKAGNFLVYSGTDWLFWLESNGKHIVSLADEGLEDRMDAVDTGLLREAFRILFSRLYLKKIVVERWNGKKLDEAPEVVQILQQIGGERDSKGMVLWPSALKKA